MRSDSVLSWHIQRCSIARPNKLLATLTKNKRRHEQRSPPSWYHPTRSQWHEATRSAPTTSEVDRLATSEVDRLGIASSDRRTRDWPPSAWRQVRNAPFSAIFDFILLF